ncbi:MAG TPA: cupredoxin domain-containing protein [Acidimicrobiia bacterium]
MRKLTLAMTALALFLAACGGGSEATTTTAATGTTAPSDQVLITVDSLSFPAEVTIPAGKSVAWKNEMLVIHQIVFDTHDGQPAGLDPMNLNGGATVEITLEPGTWAYFCGLHSQMTGTLVVEG